MTLPQQKFGFPPSADLSHNPTCYCFNHGEQGGHGQIDHTFPSDYKVAATVRSVSSSSTGWTLRWGDFTTFMTPSSPPQMPEAHQSIYRDRFYWECRLHSALFNQVPIKKTPVSSSVSPLSLNQRRRSHCQCPVTR